MSGICYSMPCYQSFKEEVKIMCLFPSEMVNPSETILLQQKSVLLKCAYTADINNICFQLKCYP